MDKTSWNLSSEWQSIQIQLHYSKCIIKCMDISINFFPFSIFFVGCAMSCMLTTQCKMSTSKVQNWTSNKWFFVRSKCTFSPQPNKNTNKNYPTFYSHQKEHKVNRKMAAFHCFSFLLSFSIKYVKDMLYKFKSIQFDLTQTK